MTGIVIVGAGHGGVQLAASLRDAGYGKNIRLLSSDPDFPYHKPPLSKSFMKADDVALQPLRGEVFFEQNNIDLKLGTNVEKIDRNTKSVHCSDGVVFDYSTLVLATGTRARTLTISGANLAGVHTLRTAADARTMRDALPSMKRVVVIGGGFIGLEAAAMLSARGIQVDVVEVAERLLGRATSEVIAAKIADYLLSTGVTLHLNQTVEAVLGEVGRVSGVQLSDRSILADHVLVGIGAIAMDELAREADLLTDNGIVVDGFLATNDPDIFALGDCVSFPQVHSDRLTRLESVQNATDQARALALTLTGRPARYFSLPWFWSDIGNLKLQIAGLSNNPDELIQTFDPEGALKSVYHLKSGRLIACETLNSGGEHMLSRRMISEGITPTTGELASGDLKVIKQAYQKLTDLT
jgi:3-phenylpropionate/trans-cinnamate dioxygenase ferredoxin reductase component